MTFIKTERSYLRAFKKTDFDELYLLMKDHEVMKYTGFREVQSEEKSLELLSKWTKSKNIWAAVETDSEDLIGWFMLKKTILDAPELGFMITKTKWNLGFATEVSKGILDYAFNILKIEKVIATTDLKNSSSINVLKKLGFVKTKSYSEDKDVLYFEAFRKN